MFNGLDRRDSSKGYSVENCVPCCSEINYLKGRLNHDKFIALCLEVAAHMTSKPQTAAAD